MGRFGTGGSGRLVAALRLLLLTAWLAWWGTSPAQAQPQQQPGVPAIGQPGWITALRGQVGVTLPGAAAPVPADNRPLGGGERIETATDARALLGLGSTSVRIGPRTDLLLRRLDDDQVVLELAAGSIAVQITAQAWADRLVFLTPGAQWRARGPGHFRIDCWADGVRGTAWEGELRFDAAQGTLAIPAGRRADLQIAAAGEVRLTWGDPVPDEFAGWVRRDAAEAARSQALRHVSPELTGWEDLDAHGDWVSDPEQGSVWIPRGVGPGWTPYGDGRWTWVAPWGWTWVDASVWGFAPFHYGSWIQWRGRWAWVPGPRHEPPRFAPAPPGWKRPPHSAPPPLPPKAGPSPVPGVERPPRAIAPVPRPPEWSGRQGGGAAPPPRAGPPGIAPRSPERPERPERPDAPARTGRTGPAPAVTAPVSPPAPAPPAAGVPPRHREPPATPAPVPLPAPTPAPPAAGVPPRHQAPPATPAPAPSPPPAPALPRQEVEPNRPPAPPAEPARAAPPGQPRDGAAGKPPDGGQTRGRGLQATP